MSISESAEKLRRQLLHRRASLEAELGKVKAALVALDGLDGVGQTPLEGDRWTDIGMTEAARRLLSESGKPMTTRQLVDEMLRRGVQTQSKKPVATLYVVLRDASGFNFNHDQKAWELSPSKSGAQHVTR